MTCIGDNEDSCRSINLCPDSLKMHTFLAMSIPIGKSDLGQRHENTVVLKITSLGSICLNPHKDIHISEMKQSPSWPLFHRQKEGSLPLSVSLRLNLTQSHIISIYFYYIQAISSYVISSEDINCHYCLIFNFLPFF